MKLHARLVTLALALAGATTLAADSRGGHHDDHQPRHGGIVAEGRDWDFELVARTTLIQLHLRGHGKPADIARASGRLTLLNGTERQEVDLKPAGDRLEAAGSFKVGPGTKAVAVVTVNGKAATARFVLK